MYCRQCGRSIEDASRFCIWCGTAQSGTLQIKAATQDARPTGFSIVTKVAIAIFVAFMGLIVLAAIDKLTNGAKLLPPPHARTVKADQKADYDFKQMTPAEHLAIAKGNIGTYLDRATARKHLHAIPEDAAEFKQVAGVERTLDAKQKQIEVATLKAQRERDKAQRERDIETNPLEVVWSSWSKGGFDTVALWTVRSSTAASDPSATSNTRRFIFPRLAPRSIMAERPRRSVAQPGRCSG